jgi:hypothetical protein
MIGAASGCAVLSVVTHAQAAVTLARVFSGKEKECYGGILSPSAICHNSLLSLVFEEMNVRN